jgi:hypothetical protein
MAEMTPHLDRVFPISGGCTGGNAGAFRLRETIELGEELVGSNLHKAHLYHWLKFNNHDRPVRPTIHI